MSNTNLIRDYFDAFNANDSERMLACLAENVEHHPNEGAPRHGIAAFRAFLAESDRLDRLVSCPPVVTSLGNTRQKAGLVRKGRCFSGP